MGRRQKALSHIQDQVLAENPELRKKFDDIKLDLLTILAAQIKDPAKKKGLEDMPIEKLMAMVGKFESQTRKLPSAITAINIPTAPPAQPSARQKAFEKEAIDVTPEQTRQAAARFLEKRAGKDAGKE